MAAALKAQCHNIEDSKSIIIHYGAAGIASMASSSVEKGTLTVYVNIAADVRAAERVGNLAGYGFSKERVVDNNFICVAGDLLDCTSSFGPPGE